MPSDTMPLTEEQFKTFLEQAIATKHSRRIPDGLPAQNAATVPGTGYGSGGGVTPGPPTKPPGRRRRAAQVLS